MNLQTALNAALGSTLKTQLKVDGKFGAGTTAAVKLFQKMNKISATGTVGVKTGAALTALNIPMSN
jgi:peptidoglycan hydrolase-like protein with peptidoglycan-binding domain